MISAKDAATLSKIGSNKEFKRSLRELESDIKRYAAAGEHHYYCWAVSDIEENEAKIIDILTSKGYKISRSPLSGMIHIEW